MVINGKGNVYETIRLLKSTVLAMEIQTLEASLVFRDWTGSHILC